MSYNPPPGEQPFVPPPPPSAYGNSLYPPDVLATETAKVASEARTALILSILGIFCFGFIFGYLAFRKASDALETIEIYGVAQDKKGLATTAKILGLVDIVLWGLGLVLRFTLLNH